MESVVEGHTGAKFSEYKYGRGENYIWIDYTYSYMIIMNNIFWWPKHYYRNELPQRGTKGLRGGRPFGPLRLKINRSGQYNEPVAVNLH
jgi:hypothetical protein